jgi:hypothetical protein
MVDAGAEEINFILAPLLSLLGFSTLLGGVIA